MSEFTHYQGCRGDKDNCSACALLTAGEEGPNYSGWPLSFLKQGRTIPLRYFKALTKELDRLDNESYVKNLKEQLKANGYAVERMK